MIKNSIRDQVLKLLSDIETEENVRILYACESGSRAWGFPSSDSDYDVRFIYINELKCYLSINDYRDVIERPINDQMDLSGWDIRKALNLYRKSNPPLLEWLKSPIIYIEKYSFAQELRKLLPEFYSPISSMYHYMNMAKGNVREYLKGDEVWVKKYFYVLRPILACKWIMKDLGPMPMEFEMMVDKIIKKDELRAAIGDLLEQKHKGMDVS